MTERTIDTRRTPEQTLLGGGKTLAQQHTAEGESPSHLTGQGPPEQNRPTVAGTRPDRTGNSAAQPRRNGDNARESADQRVRPRQDSGRTGSPTAARDAARDNKRTTAESQRSTTGSDKSITAVERAADIRNQDSGADKNADHIPESPPTPPAPNAITADGTALDGGLADEAQQPISEATDATAQEPETEAPTRTPQQRLERATTLWHRVAGLDVAGLAARNGLPAALRDLGRQVEGLTQQDLSHALSQLNEIERRDIVHALTEIERIHQQHTRLLVEDRLDSWNQRGPTISEQRGPITPYIDPAEQGRRRLEGMRELGAISSLFLSGFLIGCNFDEALRRARLLTPLDGFAEVMVAMRQPAAHVAEAERETSSAPLGGLERPPMSAPLHSATEDAVHGPLPVGETLGLQLGGPRLPTPGEETPRQTAPAPPAGYSATGGQSPPVIIREGTGELMNRQAGPPANDNAIPPEPRVARAVGDGSTSAIGPNEQTAAPHTAPGDRRVSQADREMRQTGSIGSSRDKDDGATRPVASGNAPGGPPGSQTSVPSAPAAPTVRSSSGETPLRMQASDAGARTSDAIAGLRGKESPNLGRLLDEIERATEFFRRRGDPRLERQSAIAQQARACVQALASPERWGETVARVFRAAEDHSGLVPQDVAIRRAVHALSVAAEGRGGSVIVIPEAGRRDEFYRGMVRDLAGRWSWEIPFQEGQTHGPMTHPLQFLLLDAVEGGNSTTFRRDLQHLFRMSENKNARPGQAGQQFWETVFDAEAGGGVYNPDMLWPEIHGVFGRSSWWTPR